MTKLSLFKSLLAFFKDPTTYFYSWKVVDFIKDNTLLTVFICGAAILAVIFLGYVISSIFDKLKL